MKRTERLAMHYIRASDLRAIFIAQRGRVIRIGITRDPKTRGRDLKRKGETLGGVYWCDSSMKATALLASIAAVMVGIETGIRASVAAAQIALIEFAKDARIGLTPDEVVQARAKAVVAEIDDRVKAMQSSGHLRALNQQYRKARADAAKQNRPFHSYGDHLERYKIGMLYELARIANEGERKP